MKNKVIVIVLVLLMGIIFTACDDPQGGNNDPQNNINTGSDQEIVLQQYFGSSAYVFDGADEENGELMPPVEFKLDCKDVENTYIAAVNSLLTTPEGQDEYCTMVSEDYVINGITVGDGIAYVDFSSENLTGGAINEMVMIDQIVYTLSNSFEEIAAVQFTVDGKKAETLMGQVDISEAFVADYL